ncbi:MAG: hypothetical protein ACP5O1_11615 [Phycisphaerae bacterium]
MSHASSDFEFPAAADAGGELWIEKLWDSGQRLLVAGRYAAARRELEAAEATAFHRRDAALLARIYLPLLEACRQLRQLSTEGIISISASGRRYRSSRAEMKRSAAGGGGVIITASPAMARAINRRARLCSRPIECLLLLTKNHETRILSPHVARFSCGLPVLWRPVDQAQTLPAPPEEMRVALPPPGIYAPGSSGHSAAAESIILLQEALALKQMRRQRLPKGGWPLVAALRNIRMVDMACEPVTIRLMREVEKVANQNQSA